MKSSRTYRLASTHGLMRQEALAALKGVDLIIHAGDVGTPGIIGQLRAVVPVVAVRGNIDKGAWESLTTTVAGLDGPAAGRRIRCRSPVVRRHAPP
jgi:predicted phosphodiesterase